ncbi:MULTISPECIES: hypothetical protein [Vibrio]|uniref:hypothetical protein n=1 Tax=Vibrio TaxID=662 RepID=UPI001E4960AB|nr:hypothetical protein [Vibrio lentus]MCC4837984.1 hypothetical protein [Vibrio lentus]
MKVSLKDYGFGEMEVSAPDSISSNRSPELLAQLKASIANGLMNCQSVVVGSFKIPEGFGNVDIPFVADIRGESVMLKVEN